MKSACFFSEQVDSQATLNFPRGVLGWSHVMAAAYCEWIMACVMVKLSSTVHIIRLSRYIPSHIIALPTTTFTSI
jgi:hypothetical protein